jgi:hypothetical protein
MERMGHSSTRAALVYLHSTSDRQRSIADAVGNVAKAALVQGGQPRDQQGRRRAIWHESGTPSRPCLVKPPCHSRKHDVTWAEIL